MLYVFREKYQGVFGWAGEINVFKHALGMLNYLPHIPTYTLTDWDGDILQLLSLFSSES